MELIRRNKINYTIEPHVNGGSPILTTENTDHTEVLFNDILGTSLGIVENGKFNEIDRTSFGQTDDCQLITDDFYTGKPLVDGLGYAFLFRNYRPELGKWQTSDPLGYPDGWNNLAYCNNWVTDCYDFLGAWPESVHNNMTRTWVRQSGGFTDEQAERIAQANNNTDSGDTHPYGITGDQSRHFDLDDNPDTDSRLTHAENDFNEAVDAWRRGNVDEALDHLGRGLHSLQDIDAHRDWDPRVPYAPDWWKHPGEYDDIEDLAPALDNTEALLNSRQQTIDFLRRFQNAIAE